jgi:hypothetical protein
MFSTIERRQKIEAYGHAYDSLVESLRQFPREMWRYRPAPDRWTIHEIIIHITDSEANGYIRGRRFVAEPNTQIVPYDEMQWAKMLRYHDRNTDEALGLFKCLRAGSYHLIKSLPDEVWSNTLYHPEVGPMTMDDWLDTYERHIPDHIAQMTAVYDAWQAARAT